MGSEMGLLKPPHVVILGGGPAGTYAAYKLAMQGKARCTLFEQGPSLGGNAGSFEYKGQFLDYGSHRLHRATDPELLHEIQGLLGDELRLRLRKGRIRLRGRWLKFPLSPLDLLGRLDAKFALLTVRDMVFMALPGRPVGGLGVSDSFASVLSAQLGATICDHFYFPYARKLWGCDPEDLSAIQARRRVSTDSFAKLLAKVVGAGNKGSFYYPQKGFGQISQELATAAQRQGAEFNMSHRVTGLARNLETGGWQVTSVSDVGVQVTEAEHVWSTLPLGVVAHLMEPAPPDKVLEDSIKFDSRAMILGYLELPIDRFSPIDAHYFPESSVRMSRLSEPKNYFGGHEPSGRTVLCAEMPCGRQEPIWTLSDAEIGKLVEREMAKVGLPLKCEPTTCFTRRLKHAYPIYKQGYELALGTLDNWALGLPNFITYGRQGLFAHDNTHHAFEMARAAVDCLGDDGFDTRRWSRYREAFKSHVVED